MARLLSLASVLWLVSAGYLQDTLGFKSDHGMVRRSSMQAEAGTCTYYFPDLRYFFCADGPRW